jgi:hypothetical protein
LTPSEAAAQAILIVEFIPNRRLEGTTISRHFRYISNGALGANDLSFSLLEGVTIVSQTSALPHGHITDRALGS